MLVLLKYSYRMAKISFDALKYSFFHILPCPSLLCKDCSYAVYVQEPQLWNGDDSFDDQLPNILGALGVWLAYCIQLTGLFFGLECEHNTNVDLYFPVPALRYLAKYRSK